MSDDEDGGRVTPQRILTLVAKAKFAGKQAVTPVIQEVLRDEVVRILRNHDPEELRRYVDVQAPVVEQELPEGYHEALSTAGPVFEDQIKATLNPATVMSWLEAPEEWMDPEENEEAYYDILEVRDIIKEHPDGEEFVAQQIYSVYKICGLTDEQ